MFATTAREEKFNFRTSKERSPKGAGISMKSNQNVSFSKGRPTIGLAEAVLKSSDQIEPTAGHPPQCLSGLSEHTRRSGVVKGIQKKACRTGLAAP